MSRSYSVSHFYQKTGKLLRLPHRGRRPVEQGLRPALLQAPVCAPADCGRHVLEPRAHLQRLHLDCQAHRQQRLLGCTDGQRGGHQDLWPLPGQPVQARRPGTSPVSDVGRRAMRLCARRRHVLRAWQRPHHRLHHHHGGRAQHGRLHLDPAAEHVRTGGWHLQHRALPAHGHQPRQGHP